MVGLIDKVTGTLKEAIGRLRSDKRTAVAAKADGPKKQASGPGATRAAKPKIKGRARPKKR